MTIFCILFSYLLVGLVTAILTLTVNNNDFIISITFAINVLFSTYCLWYGASHKKVNAYAMFFIYYAYFLIFIPMFQYIYNTYPWNEFTKLNVDNSIFIIANIAILLSMVFFHFGYRFTQAVSLTKDYEFIFKVRPIHAILVVCISVSAIAVVVMKLGVTRVFFRDSGGFQVDGITLVVIDNFIRMIPVALILLLLASTLIYKQRWILILFLLCILIIMFPLSVPRFKLLAVYLPILIIMGYIRNNRHLIYAFFGIYFIAYPLFGVLRRINSFDNIAGVVSGDFQIIDIASGDFDNYAMFLRLINYVSTHAFSYGYNILSAIFFFVPRVWWPDKAIGSGNFIADNLGWKFQNVSMPLVGDFYLAFGIIGVIIGFYFFGKIIKYLDAAATNSIKYFISIVIIGMMPFILRGALISTWAYTAGYIAALFVASFLIKMLIKPKVV